MALVLACATTAIAAPNFVPAPGSPYGTGGDTEPYSAMPGNFNGDALTDLVVVNGNASTVQIFDQVAGNGGFGLAATGFASSGGPNVAAVADFNGDGRQDLAVPNFLDNTVSVYRQQPDGTFAQEGAAISVTSPTWIATGDLNGDGRTDLAVSAYPGTVAIILRNNANTGFKAPTTSPSDPAHGTTEARALAIGDFDGANGPDIAVTNPDFDNVGVLLNQGGGVFNVAHTATHPVGDDPLYITAAKLDGDTTPDVAVTNFNADTVSVLSGATFSNITGSPFAVGDGPEGIATADFDGSGRQDLVVANLNSGSFTLLRNDGATFTRTQDVPLTQTGAIGISTGLYNDGDLTPDVAVTSVAGASDHVSVFLNKQSPTASTGGASAISQTGATLNGTVNPQRGDTDAHFEYGTTTAYGSTAPAGGEIPVGTDAGDHAVSRAIDGLTANTTYHYRIVASSFGGTVAGADSTFTTLAPGQQPPPPPPPPHEGAPAPPGSIGSGPPQAYLVAPTEVAAGTPTVLSAQGSTPAADLVSFKLDLDGSGNYATDLGPQRSLQTVFTHSGDIKVGLRVTDNQGRVDTVRRTVHVTSPPLYGFSFSPSDPDIGDQVTFKIRQLIDNPASPGAPLVRDLPDGTITTMTYGDGSKPTGNVEGIRIVGRAASPNGTFTHSYDKTGTYKVHVTVDDGHGYQQALDATVGVNHNFNYQPAITTPTTTVDQGSCVQFANATGDALGIHEAGTPRTIDADPKNLIPVVAPDLGMLRMGGLNFDANIKPNINTIKAGTLSFGNPLAQLTFTNANLALQFNGRRTKTRQAEPTVTYAADDVCRTWDQLNRIAINIPPPPTASRETKWASLPSCGGTKLQTYSGESTLNPDLVSKTEIDTRHTWFSINRWDFGDGTTSGSPEYYPSLPVVHPYNKAGNYTVKLSTTFPRNLDNQAALWNAGCTAGKPLDATKPDDRFLTRTTQLNLHVKAHFARIRSRGLSMTTDQGYFEETDFPGVYETSGSIYLNTRRANGKIFDDQGRLDPDQYVGNANGVIIVAPRGGPLKVVPDNGEIIGAADLYWMNNAQQLQLGPMPTTIKGTPGLVIPPDSGGGAHDFGIFDKPPATLGSGAGFPINWAHPILRESGGGTLEVNVHLPPPLGPNGQGSDETVSRTVNGTGRAVKVRGLFDDFEVDIPPIELIPGKVSFEGGKLSHHSRAVFPDAQWTAQGALKVFKFDVDMSPKAAGPGCRIHGGIGFDDNAKLLYAGAAVKGLKIPIPNPPAPNPVSAFADPAFNIFPGADTRPLDIYGCITYEDYPEGDAFQIVGCAGLLFAGDGVNVPSTEKIPFCPNQLGDEYFALNDHNAGPLVNGSRLMKGVVVRVSGDLGLGPDHYRVLKAYVELRTDPFDIAYKAHYGQDFEAAGGRVSIAADINGNFHSVDDWYIAGQGDVTQNIICPPFLGCLSEKISLIGSSQGLGGCVSIHFVSMGGVVRFKPLKIEPLVPCDMEDLVRDLGVTIQRGLPTGEDMLRRPGDPTAVTSAVQSGPVTMAGGAPYSMVVVNGQGASPQVQVHDPDGNLVLDDTGAAVQSLDEQQQRKQTPQGILHNDGSQYHDQQIDMRNSTIVFLRTPKKGKYTITAKPGSAPITAISHADALPGEQAKADVQSAQAQQQKKGSAKEEMLAIRAALAPSSKMAILEQSQKISHQIAEIQSQASGRAVAAQVSRHIRFTPALGPAEKRTLVGVISRKGIPVKRIVLGSYRSPSPPKAGKVRKLRVKRKGSRFTISWKPAKNAQQYEIRFAMRRGLATNRSVGAKKHKLVISNAFAKRYGATVTVRAIGPLLSRGPAAKKRVKPAKLKRIKHFVL